MRERALAVGVLPNHAAVTRLGIRVKHGVAGAVGRNAAKRLFREAYRRNTSRLACGWDMVVVLTRTAGLSVTQLENELLSACAKLKLLGSGTPQ